MNLYNHISPTRKEKKKGGKKWSFLPVTSGNKEQAAFCVSNWRAAISNHLGEILCGAHRMLPPGKKRKRKKKVWRQTGKKKKHRRLRERGGSDINGKMAIGSGPR